MCSNLGHIESVHVAAATADGGAIENSERTTFF
jgi:hypothetical protein